MSALVTSQAKSLYVLLDRNTSECRYVGCTNDVTKRRSAHRVAKAKAQSALTLWLRSMPAEPEFLVLEVSEQWEQAEEEWIAYFRFIGADLVNASSGGASAAKGVKYSEARKQLLAQRSKRMWDSLTPGKKEERIAKIHNGMTEASKASKSRKLHVANTGKRHSEATKEKIRQVKLANVYEPTEQQRAIMSASAKCFWADCPPEKRAEIIAKRVSSRATNKRRKENVVTRNS